MASRGEAVNAESTYNGYVKQVADRRDGWGTPYMLGLAIVQASLIIGKAIITAATILRRD